MILDVIVIAVLLVSAIIAFLRGFIREVLTILGMVGATLAAVFIGPVLSPMLHNWFTGPGEEEASGRLFGIIPYSMAADVIAYGGIFIIVIFVLSIVSHMVAESAKAMGLGPVDRMMGIGFGLLRGVFMLVLLYLPFHMLLGAEAKANWFSDSKTHPYLERAAGWTRAMLPKEMMDDIEGQAKELEKVAIEKKKQQQDSEGKAKPGITGYTEEFREEMDRLFDDESATPDSEEE